MNWTTFSAGFENVFLDLDFRWSSMSEGLVLLLLEEDLLLEGREIGEGLITSYIESERRESVEVLREEPLLEL